MNIFTEKLREVILSVLPITIIVLVFHFTLTPLGPLMLGRFLVGTVFIILGLTVFLIGVDLGIVPLGELTGASLAKSNSVWIVVCAGLLLGFVISIAEPGLIVLANQVDFVTSGTVSSMSILVIVSVGMAVMLALGFVRIVSNVPLYKILTVLYGLTFFLAIFSSSEFLAISFDASGATTGVLAVPFILALALGVSNLKKDSKASEKDSFGLVAITSVGAIMAVLIMGLLSDTDSFSATLSTELSQSSGIFWPFLLNIPTVFRESFVSLFPLLLILVVLQRFSFKLNHKPFFRIVKGFVYALVGLLVFMVGVNTVFMDVGAIVGFNLANQDSHPLIITIGFMLGVTTILAEPAVYVLTRQIEEVTAGYVKRNAVLIALSAGVGLAVALSMLRILTPGIQLWHYLLPGYLLSIGLMYVVPKLFVGIAFDAGGVATGPMTATFILAFTQGVAESVEGASILVDGFGMIATVAMMPIITMQILGLVFKIQTKKGGLSPDELH